MRKVVNNIALCFLLLSAEPISATHSRVFNTEVDSALNTLLLPPHDVPKNIPKSDTVFVNIKRISFAQVGRLSQNVPINEQGAVLTQDLLQTGAFFKQYGISGSATISKRGADATQTQVLWNGLPINHPMLGMTDFNNFSTFGLSELTFIDGGNSSMYGSGSVGGTVLMNHDAEFNKGKIINAAIALGSFSNHQLAGTIGYSGKKAVIQFSQSAVKHQNSFTYFDRTFEQTRKVGNSEFSQFISRVLATAQLSKHSQTKLVLESANMNRGLGMLTGSFNTLGNQKDQSIRGVLEHKYQKGKFAWIQKFGGSQDQIVFTQSGIKDSSQAQLRFAMTELYFTVNSKTQILTGIDFQQQRGNTQYYQQTQIRNLPAQFISLRQKRNKTQWLASARWEWNERMPSAGLGQETKIGKNCLLKSDLHTSFRRATLNDLYWAQPGTASLNNETGWEAEAGLVKWNAHLKWEMTAFYRELLNPIIWMPAGGLWSARNYYFGRYYGLQNKLKFQYTHFFGHLSADWVRTRVKSHESSDLLQQIFIPDLMANIQTGFIWKNWKISSELSHTGNRFIQTDNWEVMKSYRLWGAQLQYTYKHKYAFSLNAQNLLNTVYENMPGRPMPGRSIQIQMNIKL
jgi:iron complex outermembrane receptor protein